MNAHVKSAHPAEDAVQLTCNRITASGSICAHTSYVQSIMNAHVKRVHPAEDAVQLTCDRINASGSMCTFTTYVQNNMNAHVKAVHPAEDAVEAQRCAFLSESGIVCGARFANQRMLKCHANWHADIRNEIRGFCDSCGCIFRGSIGTSHIRSFGRICSDARSASPVGNYLTGKRVGNNASVPVAVFVCK